MKSKGFTLVELLGIMVILAVILILVFPAVNSILSKSEETVYQQQINKILSATYDLSLRNLKYLPSKDEKTYITLGELKTEGLIDVNIINPETQQKFNDNLVISIYNVGNNYKYSNTNSKLEGDYLYTIETNISNINELLPTIIINNLSKNSDGNYITTIDLNNIIDINDYEAISSKGINITDKVKKYILKDEVMVENIDTNQPEIYKVNYTVVDEDGYSNSVILNIVIQDKTSPTIKLPSETTIRKDETNFNFLNDVSCKDNSTVCDITYSGEIDYGVAGKYIITYTAKDPSGNTATKKRVITIE